MTSKRILIIDDDEDILEILNIVFQDEGYNVVIANSSDAADHIHEYHPDMIILDVRLNGSPKDGLQICAEIKSGYHTRELPVMLLSAETDLDLLAMGCGADSFMRKPFDIYQLLQHVEKQLS